MLSNSFKLDLTRKRKGHKLRPLSCHCQWVIDPETSTKCKVTYASKWLKITHLSPMGNLRFRVPDNLGQNAKKLASKISFSFGHELLGMEGLHSNTLCM